ncbi:MAG: RecX family transcriptional regulator [Deltaproteobacteria bacterium]|nr:RecX family transcriptional regulator [Deltaproteobacteria bacterium]
MSKAAAPPSALDQALRWLAVRDRTEGELRLKLKRKSYPADQIAAALERLRGLGYLDDARFARGRAEALLSRGRLGPRGVESRLLAAGLDRELISTAVRNAMATRDELSLARAALARRHPEAPGTPDRKLRSKAVRFLLGRGFSSDVVSRALGVDVDGGD